VALAELKKWLEEEIAPIVEPLKAEGRSMLSEVKSRLEDVRESGDRLFLNGDKEMRKESPKTYRCAKAANKLGRYVLDITNRIVVPDDASYESLRLLVGDLEKALAAIGKERRVWYPRISPYFILDRKRLDVAIKRAEDSILELRSFLLQKYVKAKIAENALAMADKLSQLLEQAENIQKKKVQTETHVKLLEEKIQETQRKIELTQNETELNKLSRIEQKINSLKENVKHNLRHLQKPFYKLQSLARSSKIALPPDEAKKLRQYMENPFNALASEKEGHPILKRLLQKVDDAIHSGKMKLKTTRLRKAQAQINSILKNDSLANLHKSCLEAISERKRLLTSEAIATTQRELEKLQTHLQNLQKKRELLDAKVRSFKEEHEKMLKRIEAQKSVLEKSILRLTGKRVHVT